MQTYIAFTSGSFMYDSALHLIFQSQRFQGGVNLINHEDLFFIFP